MPHESSSTMLITMVAALSAGIILIAIARRLNLPAIVLLLGGGVLLGPVIWGEHHAPVQAKSLGDGLGVIVSLFVGLILFEGGLTLDRRGYRSAPRMIRRLLSGGVLITWISIALVIRVLFELPLPESLLAASLVVVTGPTVIGPLLQRVRVEPKIHSILHWESVLIDPIGVFLAILCYEVVVSGASGQTAAAHLAIRVFGGIAIGAAGGLLLRWVIRKNIVPEDMVNVFSVGIAVLVFGLAESLMSEAGLLAVTVAGFLLGLSDSASLKPIRTFKAELTDLLVGTLFILLASRLSLEQFADFGLEGALAVIIVMLVVRPMSIFLCSIGLNLTLSQRLFLSWIAPRGIVAASMASLFALGIDSGSEPGTGAFIETFTYSVIVATIVIQGLTAGPVARLLGLREPERTGWMIVGTHTLARRIARFIRDVAELPVVLVDTNQRGVREARDLGFTAIQADARDHELAARDELLSVGNLLALTDNEDLNARICVNWAENFGNSHVLRAQTSSSERIASVDDDPAAGRMVWARLPRPTMLAGEIRRGDAVVHDRADGNIPARSLPLLIFRDGRVTVASDHTVVPEGVDACLSVERTADYFARSLRDELVFVLEAGDMTELLSMMLDRVVAAHPALDQESVLEDLLDRERTHPTRLGHQIIVPHVEVSGIDSHVCAVARIPAGLDYGTGPDARATLAFLLLSPAGDPEAHLTVLGDIARLTLDPARRAALARCTDGPSLLRILLRGPTPPSES